MRVVGIDPGSHIVGFGCLDLGKGQHVGNPNRWNVVDAGVLKADGKARHCDRITALHEALYALLDELKPDICIMERAFTGVNALSALRLGEARGALISAAGRLGIPLTEITPAEAKRTIAGNGAASKEQVSLALESLLRFKRGALPHDASDALAIAYCGALTAGVKPRASKNTLSKKSVEY